MAKLVDGQGEEAVVGRVGYWLDSGDFVSTADLDAEHIGQIGFPRAWPGVYGSSKALKQLVGKKGKCAGKKVGVVPLPDANQLSLVKGVQFHPLQSFSNAERAAKAAGIDIVRGWAVYEHLEKDVSEAFVAERFWWNSLADGTWVDFTPRPQMFQEKFQEMLLAEAVDGAPQSTGASQRPAAEVATAPPGPALPRCRASYGSGAGRGAGAPHPGRGDLSGTQGDDQDPAEGEDAHYPSGTSTAILARLGPTCSGR